ncbi:MAG TPA: biotin--[acetyl-CoA-carboxylase] ligase [Candidatus Polarisedimenticolaceae bacterium]
MIDDLAFVSRVIRLERTGSTNDDLRRLAAAGAPEGTVVIAGAQDAGRGRLGRAWHSAPGLGLYLSVLLRPRRPVAEAPRWALAAAAAGAEACEDLGVRGVEVKWPNDLLLDDRKLAGFLSEMRALPDGSTELVLGAGFNVAHRAEDFPAELGPFATSLALALGGEAPARERVAESFLSRLASFAPALAEGRFDEVAARWSARAPRAAGARVRVRDPDGDYEAVTRGLAPDGALRVERDDGTRATLHSVDVLVSWETGHAAGGGCR